MMKLNKQGFTIVELLIALTFFSFLLLVVTYGFVQVNRTYTRGITTKTIQETARTVVEDVTRTLRFSDQLSPIQTATDGHFFVRIGDVCYAWNQHIGTDENDDSRSRTTYADDTSKELILAKGDLGVCGDTVNVADSEELLDERAVVQYLSVESLGSDTYRISIVVSTDNANNNDLLTYGQLASCKVQIGDQFCDVAKYETAVHTRN